MFSGPFAESIVCRALKTGKVEIKIHQLRNWAEGKHQIVDDRPFGGGVGMLLKIEPIYEALSELLKLEVRNGKIDNENGSKIKSNIQLQNPASHFQHPTSTKIVLLDAGGQKYSQAKAHEFSKVDHIILICGRYEGVDHRVREHLIDEEISIGDYVLTGGEIPAMVVVDSIVRLIPGVLTKEDATELESFSKEDVVEYPQYTRPEEFKGWKVPEVLLSGNHKKIEDWHKEHALKRSTLRKSFDI